VLAVGVSSARHADIDAEAECAAVAARYAAAGLSHDTLVGAAATRAALLARLHGPVRPGVLLHVACHGEFELDDPMSSHLALADGRLDAASIVRGRLAYDEVLLSACSTGRRALALGGVELAGDEIIGLAGAFLEAGARTVVVSLSPTADQASLELMQQLHAARIAGQAPRQALQRAQQQLAADGIFPPEQWGGFVVFGAA
jgi:CHAT domain-containing protein